MCLVLMLVGDWAFEEPKFGDILHDDINATASMEGVWPLRPYDVYLFLQTLV